MSENRVIKTLDDKLHTILNDNDLLSIVETYCGYDVKEIVVKMFDDANRVEKLEDTVCNLESVNQELLKIANDRIDEKVLVKTLKSDLIKTRLLGVQSDYFMSEHINIGQVDKKFLDVIVDYIIDKVLPIARANTEEVED